MLTSAAPGSDADGQLTGLAWRIAENRVVAGVHYLEDIQAGIPLGEALARYVQFMAGYPASLAAAPAAAVNWLWRQASAEGQDLLRAWTAEDGRRHLSEEHRDIYSVLRTSIRPSPMTSARTGACLTFGSRVGSTALCRFALSRSLVAWFFTLVRI